jgi:hypothetical protein
MHLSMSGKGGGADAHTVGRRRQGAWHGDGWVRDQALRVSSFTRMQQLAFCMSRAARITADPTAVYSRRVSLPTSPQMVAPVAIPTHDCTGVGSSLRRLRISMAQCTARTGSSSCAMTAGARAGARQHGGGMRESEEWKGREEGPD